jgi:integrase
MARRRSVLSSRTSRAELPSSDAPEWEVISPGVRLGYRRGRGTRAGGGSWLAAARSSDGKRLQTRLGKADDVAAADGVSVFSHEQAKDAARRFARSTQVGASASPALTVNDALDRYLEARATEGMKSVRDAEIRASAHIRPKLGKARVAELTVDRVRRWRDELAKAPKRLRTGKHAERRNVQKVDPNDAEAMRKRRDTANRTLTLLKAALNWARDQRLADDDTAWRLVKAFRNTSGARVRFLDMDEQRALLENCSGAIRNLVAAALMTGARFGELSRLTARDLDPDNGSVFIAESKAGKSRHVPLTTGGLAFFRQLAEGRKSTDHLLTQESGQPWRKSTYHREFRAAVGRAGLGRLTLHELRHSYASTMVRAGAPLIVVGQALGHADTRMAEKHYAHLAPSYVADTIRRTAPDLYVLSSDDRPKPPARPTPAPISGAGSRPAGVAPMRDAASRRVAISVGPLDGMVDHSFEFRRPIR